MSAVAPHDPIVISDDDDDNGVSGTGSQFQGNNSVQLELRVTCRSIDNKNEEIVTKRERNTTNDDDEVDTCRVLRKIKVDRLLVNKYLNILRDLDDRVKRTVRLLRAHGEFKENGERTNTIPDGRTTPIDKVQGKREDGLEANEDDLPNSVRLHRAILKDVDVIAEFLPDVDRHEVYAYLEAHRERNDRVSVVVEELLTGEAPCDENDISIVVDYDAGSSADFKKRKDAPCEGEALSKKVRSDLTEEEPGTSVELTTNAVEVSSSLFAVDHLEGQYGTLKDMFPDADPDYLMEFVAVCDGDDERLKVGVENMLQMRNYPRLKDKLERERKEQMRMIYTTRQFTPEEILQWRMDPLVVFYNTERPVGDGYKGLTERQLQNTFPHLKRAYLKSVLHKNNFHFLPCLRELEKLDWKKKGRFFKSGKTRFVELPTQLDEQFYKELAFARVEQQFREYLDMKAKIRKTKVETARANGTLLTCNCCFDNECIMETIVECPKEHTFCMDCVRRGMEIAIGQGKTALECMTGECKKEFSLQTLQLVLSPNVFSNLLKKIQAAEIELAGIPDLEMCPFCSFAVIIPNNEDKVFHCLNPDCLKETCRLCKEPSHIPFKCHEVEKSSEVQMRTYIENKMSEALMRECPSCKKHFTKSDGCNMMTCICGAKMCYVCRQPIKHYGHFGPDKCPQMSDVQSLHVNDVWRGAEQAKLELISENPDMVGLNLKHDPTEDIGRF